MKRNNIFMWAYITFMVLGCIVRAITDFSMWSPIVMAITISSMFFSIEDLFSSVSGMYEHLNKIRDHGISGIREMFKQDLAVDDRIEQLYEENKDLFPELREQLSQFKEIKKHNAAIEKLISSIENDIEKGKVIYKVCHWLSVTFAYLGFLLLFASMILVSFVNISPKLQELITVASFAIILVTSQISSVASEYVKKEEDVTTELLSGYEKLIKDTQELEVNVYRSITKKKSQKANEMREVIIDAH